jgi:hypothetical protein
LPAVAAGQAVLVVRCGDPEFGTFHERWLDFAGALCDDGPMQVDEYHFHERVQVASGDLQLLRVKSGEPMSAFEGGHWDEWGFYVGPAEVVARLSR